MGFTRFLPGSDSHGIGIKIIDTSVDKESSISDYYEGIYEVIGYSYPFFSVAFIPSFNRKTNVWYQHNLFEYEDAKSRQEARLLIATDSTYSITPDAEKAGTKQKFNVALTPEQEEDIKLDRLDPEEFTHRTIYYVTPREFYTFRGEIITILTERHMGQLDLINLKEILDFSFIQFILKNVVPSEKLELLLKKAGIDSFMRKSILI